MLQTNISNIFYFDAQRGMQSAFNDIFTHQSVQTFTTDNIYQFLRYARELPPDAMILNLCNSDHHTISSFKSLEHEISSDKYPVIVMKSHNESFEYSPRIAHYLSMPLDFHKLTEIIESYSFGHKTPQLMLLDKFSSQSDKLHEWLAARNISYFEVHNIDAASLYLQKNQPRAVWIEYTPEFIAARHSLSHSRIFYVDRQPDTDEIQKFLP